MGAYALDDMYKISLIGRMLSAATMVRNHPRGKTDSFYRTRKRLELINLEKKVCFKRCCCSWKAMIGLHQTSREKEDAVVEEPRKGGIYRKTSELLLAGQLTTMPLTTYY